MTFASAQITPAQVSQADIAALLLRVAMGVLFVLHAWMKIAIFTHAGTAGYFESIGLPAVLAYVTIAVELLGGLALIAGIATRWVSLALVPVMIGAGYFGHGANGFFFSNAHGGWEYPAFWTVALFAQALLGNGAYAFGNRAPR